MKYQESIRDRYFYIFLLILVLFLTMSVFINSIVAQSYELDRPKGVFNMEITGNPEKKTQEDTNLTVVKVIDPGNGRLQYRYDIITPTVDDFHFVLALDSSSSLKASKDSDEAKAVIGAVPNFIDEAISKHGDKNFEVSIVSWDNDVDFAYSQLENRDPKQAKLVKIKNASDDIKTKLIFGEVNDTRYKYTCLDDDYTNLSIPIGAAIDILDNNPPTRHHRTSNFTILVVGDGEYSKCTEQLVRESQEKGYVVYAVLIDYSTSSDLFSYLENITGDPSRVFTCVADENTLEQNLEKQLNSALEKAISEPVAQDVVLYDHFNDFIPPGREASIEVVGHPETRKAITPIFTNNSMRIDIPGGLWAKNVTRILLDAHLDLRNLSTSSSNAIASNNESNNLSKSTLSYRWLRERYPFEIDLPESSININGPVLSGPASSSTSSETTTRRSGSIFGLLLSYLKEVQFNE